MTWFTRAWQGHERLWVVFWLYGACVPFAAYLCLVAWPLKSLGHPTITYSHFFAGWTLFNVLLIVPMWRCARNARWWLWKRLARANALIIAAEVVYFVCAGGLSDLSGAGRAYSVCTQILEDRAMEQHADITQYMNQHAPERTRCIQDVVRVLR